MFRTVLLFYVIIAFSCLFVSSVRAELYEFTFTRNTGDRIGAFYVDVETFHDQIGVGAINERYLLNSYIAYLAFEVEGYSWNSEDIASEEKDDLDQHYFFDVTTNAPRFGGGNGALARGESGEIVDFAPHTSFGPLNLQGTWTTATVATVPEPSSFWMLILAAAAIGSQRRKRGNLILDSLTSRVVA